MNKVYIWGTGKIAASVLRQGITSEIIGYIETRPTETEFKGKRVYSCEEISDNYDAIVVASTHVSAISLHAKKWGIDEEKIIFLCGGKEEEAESRLDWKHDILGEKVFCMYLGNHGIYKGSFFEKDKELYKQLNTRRNFELKEENCWPIITDKYDAAGSVSNYFWQDLWASRLINKIRPEKHYDIGSRLDGFIANVLACNIPVRMIDIRPFPTEIEGLDTIVADATELAEFEDNSIESLSALCSLEHFGLGRYGDSIDPEACFKCFASIQQKLKKNGHLYISVPIGKERVEFNAHRIFYASTIRDCFNRMELIEYSCAAENKIEYNVPIHKYDEDGHNGEYRYGLFHFVRK